MFATVIILFFPGYQGGEMLYGLSNDVGYPLKHPSSQATRSHSGKAKSYETMLPMKRVKNNKNNLYQQTNLGL